MKDLQGISTAYLQQLNDLIYALPLVVRIVLCLLSARVIIYFYNKNETNE